MLVQQILNGLVSGSVYALFALGLTLVFGIHHVLNLAHGSVFTWGGFAGLYAVTGLGVPLVVALPIAMLVGGVLGCLLELVAFRPLRRRSDTEFAAIISSLGANFILMSLAQQISQSRIERFPFGSFPNLLWRLGPVRITLMQVSIVGFLALTVGLLLLYIHGSSAGRQMRAVAVNARASVLLGVNPHAVYLRVFFISGALAGATGVIIGVAFNSVHFLMGEPFMLRGFAVIVLGGMGSVEGAVAAGLMIGLIQTMTAVYVSSDLTDTITFMILFLMLLVRPSGLFPGLIRSPERARR